MLIGVIAGDFTAVEAVAQSLEACHWLLKPVMMVSVDDVMTGKISSAQLVDFINANQGKAPLIFTSGDKADVLRAQNKYGREKVSTTLDALFGTTAKMLVSSGVRRLVVFVAGVIPGRCCS